MIIGNIEIFIDKSFPYNRLLGKSKTMWGNEIQKQEFGKLWPLWYGDSDERNYRDAIKPLTKLSDLGYAPAQFVLGNAYLHADGVRRNYEKSYKYITASAEQGFPAAEGTLGTFYSMVEPKQSVCPHDDAEAVKWYQRAAKQGNAPSMYNLANKYHSGLGVAEDIYEAYVWASLASQLSKIRFRPAEGLRDQTANKLSSEQLTLANHQIEQLTETVLKPWSDPREYWQSLWKQTL